VRDEVPTYSIYAPPAVPAAKILYYIDFIIAIISVLVVECAAIVIRGGIE
jgi:hypothetical protein